MSREQPEGYDRRYRCKHGASLGPCAVCAEERRTLLMEAAQADTHSSDVEPMVERLESKS